MSTVFAKGQLKLTSSVTQRQTDITTPPIKYTHDTIDTAIQIIFHTCGFNGDILFHINVILGKTNQPTPNQCVVTVNLEFVDHNSLYTLHTGVYVCTIDLLDADCNSEYNYLSCLPRCCIPKHGLVDFRMCLMSVKYQWPEIKPTPITINAQMVQLLYSGYRADISICVYDYDQTTGVTFRVHSAILGALSPVFDRMLDDCWITQTTNTLVIRDVNPQVFWTMLQYLYGMRDINPATAIPNNITFDDEPQLSQPRQKRTKKTVQCIVPVNSAIETVDAMWWIGLLLTADLFQIDELVATCETKLIAAISIEAIYDILESIAPIASNTPRLFNEAIKFARQHINNLIITPQFGKLNTALLTSILSCQSTL